MIVYINVVTRTCIYVTCTKKKKKKKKMGHSAIGAGVHVVLPMMLPEIAPDEFNRSRFPFAAPQV